MSIDGGSGGPPSFFAPGREVSYVLFVISGYGWKEEPLDRDDRSLKDANKKSRAASAKRRKAFLTTYASSAAPPVHDLIGQKLRGFYDEVAREPVPDRFIALLDELEAKSGDKSQA